MGWKMQKEKMGKTPVFFILAFSTIAIYSLCSPPAFSTPAFSTPTSSAPPQYAVIYPAATKIQPTATKHVT